MNKKPKDKKARKGTVWNTWLEKENLHDNRKSTIEDKIWKNKSHNMTGEMVVKRQEIRIQGDDESSLCVCVCACSCMC